MMSDPNPAAGAADVPASKVAPRNLMLRVISSAVLAPVAIGIAYFGGWPFAIFWTAAAIAVWWEWTKLVHPAGHVGALVTGICALIIQAFLLMNDREDVAIMIAGLGALAAAIISARNAVWTAAGVVYASILVIAPVMIRGGDRTGFLAIAFVFAVVWATDIVAYFTGRAIGGPKLAPSISPNKTWSGAIGGTIAAIAAGAAVVLPQNIQAFLLAASIAVALSAMSQAGDLFESRIKRIFDVKDSGALIPGHGGAMDRLDGFVAAALAALAIGAVRAGWNSPAQGLIGW
jgi:phosphatidate cytidylyltransferase